MAASGSPRTIVVPGDGTNALSFVIPPGVVLDIESVLAGIDASAAGAVTATLSVAEQAGAVIATKRQSEVVDAGATGSATWALRLTDDGGGSAVAATIFFQWVLHLGGVGVGNNARALNSGRLDGQPAVPSSVSQAAEVAWTVAAGGSLALTGFNWSAVQLIFDLTQLNVQRIDAVGASFYTGNAVFCAPGAFVQIPVNALTFGPAQLNIANPNAPTVVAAGRYSVGATIAVRL